MDRVFKYLGFLLLVLCIGLAIQFVRLHDIGSRPPAEVDLAYLNDGVQFVDANDLRFGYIEAGSGPLVLLLHGYPETARSWREVQDRLAAEGYRTIAVFMRGYAPTALASEYSVRSMGQDILSLIEAFGEEEAVVIGHDWGASVAYEAAFVAPQAVSHLVTLSIPHPRGTEPSLALLRQAPHFVYYQLPTADRLVWSDDFSHISRIYQSWSPDFDMPEAEFNDIRKTMEAPGVVAATLQYYRDLIANGEDNASITARSESSVPTLVIAGDRDGTVDLNGFKLAEDAFAGKYAFELLEGVGHFPQIERPSQVADLIIEFLASE